MSQSVGPQIVAFPPGLPQHVDVDNFPRRLALVPIGNSNPGRVIANGEYAIVTYLQNIDKAPVNNGVNSGGFYTPTVVAYFGPGETVPPTWEVKVQATHPPQKDVYGVWTLFCGVVFGLRPV